MDFKRKILAQMQQWKDSGRNRKQALLIKGLRQVGKTYIVKEFAKMNYENVVYIDFRSERSVRSAFEGDFDIDSITLGISAHKNVSFVPGKTVIIFDEVQDCIDARSSVKYFVEDGRYDIIETGSLLGISGYNRNVGRGIPVGFEHILTMVPMDFEEFLWAKGVDDSILSHLKQSFDNRTKVNPAVETAMIRHLREYICVGGMPEAVSSFFESHNFNDVRSIQRNLLAQHRDDFGKYIDKDGEVQTDLKLKLLISAVFDSVPAQLSKEYKKFQYSSLGPNARSSQYREAIQWLIEAGLVTLSNNLKLLASPLEGNKDPDAFKMFMSDTGLFVSMLDDGAVGNIMDGDLGIYKGAIYEQIATDILYKMGRPLYYYRRDKDLEIDFVIRYEDENTLLEVKSKDGRAKSARMILQKKDMYKVSRCIKVTESKLGESDGILTIPQYMMYLLKERHRSNFATPIYRENDDITT